MNIIRWAVIIFLTLLVGFIAYMFFTIEYNPLLVKILYSVITLLIAYVADILIESFIKKQVHEIKERYTLKKAVSTIISILSFSALLAIWFQETTTLVVAYGILSAGIAIALQDLLRNVAGGIIIALTGAFKAGDRMQIEKEMGDVLDINVFYTTLMEIQEWVDGDQYSGRIIQIPNSFVLNKPVKNYTKDFSFIWDEIHLMLTYSSNWKKAREIVIKIAHEITSPLEMLAKNELVKMGGKYFIEPGDVEEKIYIKITDNWIDLRLRYVVNPHKRRLIRHLPNEKILEAFSQEEDIKIASVTMDIVGFPNIKIER